MFILFYFIFCFLNDACSKIEGGSAAVVFAYADAVAAALLYAEKRYFCHRGALGQVVELDGRAAFKTFGYLSLQRRRITAVYFAVVFNLEHDVCGCMCEVVPLRGAFSRYDRGGRSFDGGGGGIGGAAEVFGIVVCQNIEIVGFVAGSG